MREKGRRIVEGDAATKNCLWHTDVELSFPFYVVLFSSFNDICCFVFCLMCEQIWILDG